MPALPSPATDAGTRPAGQGASSREIEMLALAEQARIVLRRARPSNAATSLVGLLVVWLLWGTADHRVLIAWWALLTLVSATREVVYRLASRAIVADAMRWARRHEAVLAINGALFGLIGTVLLPLGDPALAAVMLATVAGIASVGLVVLATSQWAALAFTLPLLLPTIAYQLAQGTRVSIYVALALTVLTVLIVLEGRQASAHTLAMLRLRWRMDDLDAQRQQALGQAERSSAVKSQFLATMSHEMRTPLHGILGVTRLLRSSDAQADAVARAHQLEMLERSGEHLLGLINGVLDYSRMERGQLPLETTVFDLAALVESVAEQARVTAAEKGLTLALDLSIAVPCWVHADAARLRQVLLNLTGNAVKFTERGSVTISVMRGAGGHTRFELRDTGPGVAVDQREAIFDAFHQADGSFGRRHGGTGLGLTIARELARAMGGDLACAEQPPPGACFVLTLPLPQAVAPTPRAQPRPGITALRGRVLLAEDNPVNAMVAEALLRQAGLTVDLVEDGAQAVERASATRYDLILMDCQMPGMDGFQATARIRELENDAGVPRVPIVALTANVLEGDRLRSIAAGMNDHMAKPFRQEDLGLMLQRFLG
jgi:two-component system, sensor histidine kinase